MSQRISLPVPVADELISWCGGLPAFLRAVVGKITDTPMLTTWKDRPVAVAQPVIFHMLPDGGSVIGPGYAKVVDASGPTPPGSEPDRLLTWVCLTFEILGPGETATDTSLDPRGRRDRPR